MLKDKPMPVDLKIDLLDEMLNHGLCLLFDCATIAPQHSGEVEGKLRTLRRYIEFLLGERDEDDNLLPSSANKAPAFCRSECAGGAPECQGCDHGGYGPGPMEKTALYLGVMEARRKEQ